MNYLSPEDSTYFLVTRASLAVTTIFKKMLIRDDLTEIKPSYLGALMCLWASEGMDEMLSKFGSKDGMRLTELGRCAGLEPSTITGLVDRMERDGLVSRKNVPNDRRAQKATLTEKVSTCILMSTASYLQAASIFFRQSSLQLSFCRTYRRGKAISWGR